MPICPETYMSPLNILAVEQGPIALGPSAVLKVLMNPDIATNDMIIYAGTQYKYFKMSQITINNILQKIRAICQESKLSPIPEIWSNRQTTLHLQSYSRALENIRTQFIRHSNLEQEYTKLQLVLQRQETEIRKRIGVEQQLKLYTDALKIQVEELEKEKLELLENSKVYIRQLKKTNQQLYSQLHHLSQNKNKSKSNSPQRTDKSKGNKSLSHKNNKQDRSIREIIKTEYIERERQKSNSANRKKIKKINKLGGYSTISGHQGAENLNTNAKTFQVIHSSGKKEKAAVTGSKKKNNHLFSNYTLLNYLDSSNKKMKKPQKNLNSISKSPLRKENKKQGIKSRVQNVSKALWKQKKANKSIFSLSSFEPNSHKKQTL